MPSTLRARWTSAVTGARGRRSPDPGKGRWLDLASAVSGGAALVAAMLAIAMPAVQDEDGAGAAASAASAAGSLDAANYAGPETFFAGYMGYPWFLRSDVHISRPDGTDLTLKQLRWDGEPFKFPIYGGVRWVKWSTPSLGFMIDFHHNKAVPRLGKGSHGSTVTGERAIIDFAETSGTWKGKPAPSPVKLTDVVERYEFTHGHNILLFTGLLRLGSITPKIRPYIGAGAGPAIPHVEIWPAGEDKPSRTNEYQVAGPGIQALAGIEIRVGRASYFIEYKYTHAWLSMTMSGGKTPSWCNCDIVTDFARQLSHWWTGNATNLGHSETDLGAHQIVFGGGYRWPAAAVAGP